MRLQRGPGTEVGGGAASGGGTIVERLGLWICALLLLLLGIVNVCIGLTIVPIHYLRLANLGVSVLFIGLPILALFAGAHYKWTWAKAILCLAAGVLVQIVGSGESVRFGNTLFGGILMSLGQGGLILWCLGLGALLASILKDKNLLLPLAIFLALFDIWLVFVPEGPVGRIARGSQQQLVRMAYRVPHVAHVSQGGRPAPLAFVGPADFVFLAMFFVALHRFKMRSRETFLWILPVLVLYLLTVLVFPNVRFGPISLQAMPALLPIGLVVLLVNRREFKLTKEEVLSTALVGVLGVAIVSWRLGVHWHG